MAVLTDDAEASANVNSDNAHISAPEDATENPRRKHKHRYSSKETSESDGQRQSFDLDIVIHEGQSLYIITPESFIFLLRLLNVEVNEEKLRAYCAVSVLENDTAHVSWKTKRKRTVDPVWEETFTWYLKTKPLSILTV